MFYKFRSSGAIMFTELWDQDPISPICVNGETIWRNIMCQPCFQKNIGESASLFNYESAEYVIDVICDQLEFEFYVKTYGRKCCKCEKYFHIVYPVNAQESNTYKMKYLC